MKWNKLFSSQGFESGIHFGETSKVDASKSTDASSDVIVNLASLLTLSDKDELGIWSKVDSDQTKNVTIQSKDKNENVVKSDSNDIDKLVGDDSGPVLTISDSGQNMQQGPQSTEWAELMDVSQPMPDFHQKVPQMAYTWWDQINTYYFWLFLFF